MNAFGFFAIGAILAALLGGLLTMFGVFPFSSTTWGDPRSIMDLPAHERQEYDEYLKEKDNNLGER
jgi:hypothetical protein